MPEGSSLSNCECEGKVCERCVSQVCSAPIFCASAIASERLKCE